MRLKEHQFSKVLYYRISSIMTEHHLCLTELFHCMTDISYLHWNKNIHKISRSEAKIAFIFDVSGLIPSSEQIETEEDIHNRK